jgi:hypothetical protein
LPLTLRRDRERSQRTCWQNALGAPPAAYILEKRTRACKRGQHRGLEAQAGSFVAADFQARCVGKQTRLAACRLID